MAAPPKRKKRAPGAKSSNKKSPNKKSSPKKSPTKKSVPKKSAAKSARDGGPDEAASYIAEQVAELARLARRHKHDTLGFLLDMALMEAEEVIRLGKK
jgi:hypothetical protein